jgi:PAS domain S-box-containing protein
MSVMVLVRIRARQRYWSRAWTLDEQERWGARFSLGSLCAGALWGIAGGALMPDSLPHQILIVFVLGGMAAGAASSIACFMRAYYAYLIPSLLPAIARLLSFGQSEEHAMVAMLLLFSVALSLVAHNVNRAFSHAFRLRFENAALYGQVSSAQASVVTANANLRHSNEQLETRVRERTDELRASEARLAEMVSESPDAIVVFDESGRILSANAAAEQISGKPLAALIGKHIAETEILTTDDLQRANQAFGRLLDDESRSLAEYHIIRTDGQPNTRAVRSPSWQSSARACISSKSPSMRLGSRRRLSPRSSKRARRFSADGPLSYPTEVPLMAASAALGCSYSARVS